MAFNIQRRTSDIANVVVADASRNVTLPADLTVTNLVNAGILKGNASGKLVAAVAGTDFQSPISLTTTGSSGAATFSAGTLNIPNYTLAGLGGLANPMTTLGDIIYGGASGAATRLGGNTTTAKQYLSQTGNGTASAAPVWATIAGADVTGAALTKTDDTNVTLTLGGTPATALLRAASLTLGWTGTLAVGRGGSGASTLTGVLIGNGTSAFTAITGTAGQLLRRNAGDTAYEFFTPTYLTANQNITLSGDVSGSGATSITTTLATITQSTGSSFVKITLDTKGRVTGNTAVAASDLHSTYGSQTANTFYAAPNGTAGNPSFRAIVAADIPALAYVTSVALATGTTGTDINISGSPITSSGTITLNIPTASATNRGALSAADWTTFNNKQNALTNPVTGTGASGQVAYFNGTTTITSESALFWDATNDRLGIGTTSPNYPLQVRRAGGAGSLGISIDGVGTTDRAVQYFAIQDSAAGVGSGHAFYYRTPSSTTDTLGFILDENGNVGIGTTSPSSKLHIYNDANDPFITITGQNIAGGKQGILFKHAINNNAGYIGSITAAGGGTASLIFSTENETSAERMRITSGGNLLVGTTTDSGERLVVSGTSKLDGSVAVYGSSLTAASADWGIYQSVSTAKNYFSGNIGIGTTSPAAKLDVVGDILVPHTTTDSFIGMRYSATYYGGFVLNGTARSTGIVSRSGDATDYIWFGTNAATERVRITNAGNVGIGTTSPGAIFDVSGGLSNGRSIIRVTNSDTANYVTIGAGIPGVTNAGMNFALDGTSRMVISSTGNVGIGTTSPASIGTGITTLDIRGTNAGGINFGDATNTSQIYGAGSLYLLSTSNTIFYTASTERMRLDASGNLGLGVTPYNWASALKSIDIGTLMSLTAAPSDVNMSSNVYYDGADKYKTTAAATNYQQALGQHRWYIAPSGTAGNTISFTQAMTLDASGRLGVGITSPVAKLQSTGAAQTSFPTLGSATGGALYLTNTDNAYGILFGVGPAGNGWIQQQRTDSIATSYALSLQPSGGNVLIGTVTDNGYRLDVNGAGVIRGFLVTTDAIKLGANSSAPASTDAFIFRPADNTLAFGTASAERLRIDASGNVGIGTTSPAEKLTVSGNAYIAGVGSSIYFDTLGSTQNVRQYVTNSYEFHILNSRGNSSKLVLGDAFISLGTTSSAQVYINTTSNNVLIGTTTDSGFKLDVAGSGRFNSGLIVTGVGTQASPAILRVHGSDFNTAGDAKVIIGQTVSNADLQILVTGTDTRTDGLTANDQYVLSGQRLNLMNIGNGSAYNTVISLGESTTYAYGNIAFGTNTQNSAAITRMLINAIGNVGIGTTSPAERLTVANTGESIIRVQDLDGTNQFLHLGHNGGDSYFLTRNGTANGNFMWYTSDGTTTSERMRITSGGAVGIATNSPTTGYILDTRGRSRFENTFVYAANDIVASVLANTNTTYASGASISAGSFAGSFNSTDVSIFSGNITVPNSVIMASQLLVKNIKFNSLGMTATMTQSGSGVRAISAQIQQIQVDSSSTSGTASHVAGIQFLAPYKASGTQSTFTNYYGIVLNASDEYSSQIAVTNRWGIYQAGASDKNYFAAKVLVGTTTDPSLGIVHAVGGLSTDAPTGGTAARWKLGVYSASTGTATGHVQVDIGGTLYKLLAFT